MHNGHLQVEGEKMSKSLGNFVTIHELLHSDKFGGRSWPGEVLRLALLRTHYRQPIDFTVKALEEAEKTLESWDELADHFGASAFGPPSAFSEQFYDDMNTPLALANLNATADNVRAAAKHTKAREAEIVPEVEKFLSSIELLGIDMSPEARQRRSHADRDQPTKQTIESTIEPQIAARLAARAAKNWKESDRIRDELAAMGIALKDNKDGTTTWEVKR
jgi:cysteinyl-tRNA synthetase